MGRIGFYADLQSFYNSFTFTAFDKPMFGYSKPIQNDKKLRIIRRVVDGGFLHFL